MAGAALPVYGGVFVRDGAANETLDSMIRTERAGLAGWPFGPTIFLPTAWLISNSSITRIPVILAVSAVLKLSHNP